MTEHREHDDRTLLHPSEREVQTACFEFEQAWRAREISRVEEYLGRYQYEARGQFLQELIACEMDLRQSVGEPVKTHEYYERFPQNMGDVDAAYRRLIVWDTASTVAADIESDGELVGLLDDYLAQLQKGSVPDKARLLAAHPSIADQLEACLAGIDFLHGAESHETLPDRFGRYAVQGTLGKGAFGVVCLARDTELDRLVALKVPPAGRFCSTGEFERFAEEARTAAQLEHPGVVTVYDVFRDHNRVVIVQQYVQGQDLRRHLEQFGPLSSARAAQLTIGVAEAAAAAHDKGVIHRDLKPSNILLDEQGTPHVADFGLAVHKSVRRLRRGDRSGTPEYMSPEQVRGETDQLDGRSDIWSLGIVLYEMLTGQRPFGGDHSPAMFEGIEHQDPPPLCQIRPEIPAELERICLKCLSKKPADRYARMDELVKDLRQFVAQLDTRLGSTSIAVLPFRDIGREQDQDYFCDGMTEELINRLARIKNLRVVSRAAVQLYGESTLDIPEIGRRLDVEAILGGNVRRVGDQLRITAELINVLDGCRLWSERFDRDVRDVFAIQEEIAYNIVRSLELTLSAGEKRFLQAPPTADAQAYDYYLRGRKFFYQYRRRGIELALRMFSLAIKHDPTFAMAYAGIADCYCFLALHTEHDPENLQKADEASRKALELAPDSAEAHTSRGNVLSLGRRHDEAKTEFEEAVRLGPHLFGAYYLYARDCFAQGEVEKAIELYRRASEADPQDYQAPLLVAQCYECLGRPAEAEAARRRGAEIVQQRLNVNPDDVRALYMGANALVALGEIDKSMEWATLALSMEPEEPMVLYNVACICSLAGKYKEAIEHLENAVRAGLRHKGWLDHDNNLDPLRDHPRFQTLLKTLE